MADVHRKSAIPTVMLGVSVGGLSWGSGQDVAGTCKPPLLSPGDSQGQAAMDEPDLGHRRSFLCALMNFADSEQDNDTIAFVDDIDADSGASDAEEELRFQGDLGSAGDGRAVKKPGFSSRISRVPFTWEPGEAVESKRDPKRDREDADIKPQTNPQDLGAANLDNVFQSFSLGTSEDFELVQLPGMDSPSEQKRKLSSASVGLGTVREDGVAMSFPVVELTATISVPDTDASDGTNTSSRNFDQQPSISNSGRPSTSTTHSSSSMSVRSSSEEKQGRRKQSTPPRKSADFFRRLRSRTGVPDEFIERRSITPHGLLAPGPQHNSQDFPEELDHARAMVRGLQGSGKPVFGVDLDESIRLAPMKIRISHKGSTTSYRSFPLSVYKCCDFIRNSATDSTLFSSPGDAFNVSHLLNVFNTAPYGEDFSFADPSNHHYTIHDAGRIILLYLQDLPKPLVSSSVVKSWIMLARQEGAIQPTCSRPLETGLDFWAEALNRLPTASRNLTKHLLTLFAEIVTRRDSKGRGHISDADARNLASAVARGIFHTDESGRGKNSSRNLHATLALAFLVKKRGEYVTSMGRGGNGEEREEAGFLPSTREILEWKG